jgi:hypothetical protein
MRMTDSTTTFLDLSVVIDDVRIACRHHEQPTSGCSLSLPV